jgi:exodeoxyribonuclease III
VLCLQEVRIRAADAEDVARVAAALPGYSCFSSLPRDPRNVRFRGGRAYGVVTYARGAATCEPCDWDREGRVLATRVGDVVVVNVYAVNATDRPYFDPDSGEVAGTRADFKRLVQQRIAAELARWRDGVIAIGDWNVTPAAIDIHPRFRAEEPHATARAELAQIAETLDLVDVFRLLHPEQRAYTWHNKRARRLDAARVDYALVSRALVPRVTAAEVLRHRTESDHAPIAVELR